MAATTVTGRSSPGGSTPALTGMGPEPEDPSARGLLRFLDAPHQAIIETPTALVVSFDFAKLGPCLRCLAIAATFPGSSCTGSGRSANARSG